MALRALLLMTIGSQKQPRAVCEPEYRVRQRSERSSLHIPASLSRSFQIFLHVGTHLSVFNQRDLSVHIPFCSVNKFDLFTSVKVKGLI